MYLSLILLPIVSSMTAGFVGRKIGKMGAQFISTSSIFIIMLLSIIIFLEVGSNSILVYFYSIGYMETDPHNQRFFSYLNLFTFMIIILVTSNNLLVMFVG